MRGRTSAELKQLAKRALLGKYGTAVGAVLVNYAVMIGIGLALYFFLIVGVLAAALSGSASVSSAPVIAVIIVVVALFFAMMIIEYMLMPGYVNLYFNICRGRSYALGDLLFAFKHAPGKFFVISLIMVGVVVVTSGISFGLSMLGWGFHNFWLQMAMEWGFILVLYVLMFLFYLNFGQTLFILVDNPQKGIMEALQESCRMMNGNRGRYFRLILSFIGWMFMAYLSMGLAILWLMPYMGCTFAYFYLDLRRMQQAEYGVAGDGGREYPVQENLSQISLTQANPSQANPVQENPPQVNPPQANPSQLSVNTDRMNYEEGQPEIFSPEDRRTEEDN
ncbi:DUF975 family protein [Clostridium sp. MCC353]|uniref:DUF975 family protein n=1 Tax=Clostridium sp. MCC353 TaxID=2592646 RepID=UPI001C027F2E|nr:DUF975 family protein [Clostridium sp. MCC353]MBT9776310.1 DUF975 family protein [Clostridium sp. MCC353]